MKFKLIDPQDFEIACYHCHKVQPFNGQKYCLECKEPLITAQIQKQYEPLNDWVN